MLIDEARTRLRTDLADLDTASIDDDVLDRGVERAVSDLSRFLPLGKVYETTLIFAVTDEAWTSAAAPLTYVELASKPIGYDSEAVKNAAGVACTRDTDYYMDYANGKITHIPGGSIGNAESCTISYTISKVTVDVSSILSDIIRVDRVEYPLGSVPQTFVSYELFSSFLSVVAEGLDTQGDMVANKHLAVYYKTAHSAPTSIAIGSYPLFLDNTIILAGGAYILFSQALERSNQAISDFVSSRTALGSMAAIHTLINTALGKVSTYVADMDTALDAAINQAAAAATALAKINNDSGRTYLTDADTALDAFVTKIADSSTALAKVDTYVAGASESTKALLAKISTDAAILRDAIKTAVDAANSYLDEVDITDLGAANDSAEAMLKKYEDKINLVNIGDRVPDLGADYSRAWQGVATARINAAIAYTQEASQRLNDLNSYIEQAQSYATIADRFISEARERSMIATGYVTEASQRLAISDRYLAEASERNNSANAYIAEANGRLSMARAFIDEANGRVSELGGYLAEADRYVALAEQNVVLMGKLREEAIERRNEAWAIWRSAPDYIPNVSSVSVRQPSR